MRKIFPPVIWVGIVICVFFLLFCFAVALPEIADVQDKREYIAYFLNLFFGPFLGVGLGIWLFRHDALSPTYRSILWIQYVMVFMFILFILVILPYFAVALLFSYLNHHQKNKNIGPVDYGYAITLLVAAAFILYIQWLNPDYHFWDGLT